MGYGASRVVYKSSDKQIKKVTTPTKSQDIKDDDKAVESIEVADAVDKKTDEVMIPTTFVKKSGSKGDVNKYVKKRVEE